MRAALFPLAAYLRGAPELAREAVVVHEGPSARIVAASRLARRAGVRPGLTVTQARNIESGLVDRVRDPEREHTAQEVLLEIAGAFSPRVEDSGEGMVYLDIAAEDEHSLGQTMMRDMDAAGLPGRVGIAGCKLAARAAAALPRSPNVVAPRGEARFLAPLPLNSLLGSGGSGSGGTAPDGDDQEILHTLKLWGLRTVGDLAGLPAGEIHSRLGERGTALHAAARGIDPEPLTPRPPPPTFRESQTFEWPIDNLEPFLFVAREAVERLTSRLEARGMGCKRLELSLRIEPEGLHEVAIELPAPTREARTLLSLIPSPPGGRAAEGADHWHAAFGSPRCPAPGSTQPARSGRPVARPPGRRHRPTARPARPEPGRLTTHAQRPPAGTLPDRRLRPAPAATHPARTPTGPRHAGRCALCGPRSRSRC